MEVLRCQRGLFFRIYSQRILGSFLCFCLAKRFYTLWLSPDYSIISFFLTFPFYPRLLIFSITLHFYLSLTLFHSAQSLSTAISIPISILPSFSLLNYSLSLSYPLSLFSITLYSYIYLLPSFTLYFYLYLPLFHSAQSLSISISSSHLIFHSDLLFQLFYLMTHYFEFLTQFCNFILSLDQAWKIM